MFGDHLVTNGCLVCGEKDILVLTYDHIDVKDKKYYVSDLLRSNKTIELLKEEIVKCNILCHNCHAKRSAVQQRSWRLQYKKDPTYFDREIHIEPMSIGVAIDRIDPKTGEVKEYSSLQEAKKDGFSVNCISHCINGRNETHKGFYWQRLPAESKHIEIAPV